SPPPTSAGGTRSADDQAGRFPASDALESGRDSTSYRRACGRLRGCFRGWLFSCDVPPPFVGRDAINRPNVYTELLGDLRVGQLSELRLQCVALAHELADQGNVFLGQLRPGTLGAALDVQDAHAAPPEKRSCESILA